jgi:gas vesicle protein
MLVLALGGAAAGLMFAPNTGQKTREDLTHSLEQGVKNLEEGLKRRKT